MRRLIFLHICGQIFLRREALYHAPNHCIGAGDFSGGRLTTRPNWPRKVHEMKSTVETRQSGNCAKCSVTNWSLVIWLGLGVKRGFYGYA